jgi:hypothetical protein
MNEITTDLWMFCCTKGSARINHSGAGAAGDSAWSSCAVGQFYTHRTGLRLRHDALEDGPSTRFVERVEDALAPAVFDALNESAVDTYADLVDLIEQNEVIG